MRVRAAWARLARDDSGLVTVEAAFAAAAIAAFLMLGIGAVGGGIAAVRCTDAAREVARLTAAGDASAREVGAATAPSGARIRVEQYSGRVRVTVSADVPLVPMATVSSTAVAALEPDAES